MSIFKNDIKSAISYDELRTSSERAIRNLSAYVVDFCSATSNDNGRGSVECSRKSKDYNFEDLTSNELAEISANL